MVRLDIGTSCFCSGCWDKPTYLTLLCKTIPTQKSYTCARTVKLFHFDERSHFSFETFCSSCTSVGAFGRNLDITNPVHLSCHARNMQFGTHSSQQSTIFWNFIVKIRHAMHFTLLFLLKLCVNLLSNTKWKNWSKHWQDLDCQRWSDSTEFLEILKKWTFLKNEH